MEKPDGILVRSAAMHDMELGGNLLAIARAGAGVNNIPVDKCLRTGHRGVQHPRRQRQRRERTGVLAALFLTSRKIVPPAWTG